MTKKQIDTRIAASNVLSGINNMYYNLRRHEFGLINKIRNSNNIIT
jgi:hypothetical protein